MAIETMGAALRQISRLFGGGIATGLSDAQLLDRFLAEGDAASFEVLVARHGPMVLSVCRGVLRDPNDAEDAFQATFVILVKKAGTIRGGQALGGWLYQVAHRVAIQANIAAARRRALEREAGQMSAASASSGPSVPDDLLPALHDGDRPAAREIPAAGRPLRPGGPAPGRGRRPVALERAAPSAVAWPRPATGSRAG